MFFYIYISYEPPLAAANEDKLGSRSVKRETARGLHIPKIYLKDLHVRDRITTTLLILMETM